MDICAELNISYLESTTYLLTNPLDTATHSVFFHYYGREAGLELEKILKLYLSQVW